MSAIFYIEEKLKTAFYDEHVEVRKTVSSVMSMIMVRGGFNAWPDLLTFLTDNLQPALIAQRTPHLQQSLYASIIQNSILAISIIVEDCTSLFQEDAYVSIIEYMLQPVFNLLAPATQATNAIKAHAVNTINMLLVTQCSAVRQYMQEYTAHILSQYSDASVDEQLKVRILEGLTNMMEFESEIVLAHLQPTLQVMLRALQQYDQKLALSASEFFANMVQVWFTVAQGEETSPQARDHVLQWLPQLLPELLICCKLSDADKRNTIQTKEDDLIFERGGEGSYEAEEGLDAVEEVDFFGALEGSGNTTLRKSAAYTLILLSRSF